MSKIIRGDGIHSQIPSLISVQGLAGAGGAA